MSAMLFHSPSHEDVAVHGAERAHLGTLVKQAGLAFLSLRYGVRERYESLVPEGHYLREERRRYDHQWASLFETALWTSSMDRSFVLSWDDHRVDPWCATLNTVIALRSPHLTLAARLDATCELHGYVEGEHREWLSCLIDDALRASVLRPGMGWQQVMGLLEARSDEPVVMSYTVTDYFPSIQFEPLHEEWIRSLDRTPGATDEEWRDRWYEQPAERRWEDALRHLRARNASDYGEVDLHPDTFMERSFGHDTSTFLDLERWLDRKLLPPPIGAAT